MTLKNNRAPLPCCFQLCAWFHCHMWNQTGVRVRKRLSWVLTSVTLTFDLWPLTLTFCMDITFDHGNNSWKFHDDTMMGTWWKRCDRQTDGRTDWTSHIAAWSQLKTLGPLFYATSSFVHHFGAIADFKLGQCFKWALAHSLNANWISCERIGNKCQALNVRIGKYGNWANWKLETVAQTENTLCVYQNKPLLSPGEWPCPGYGFNTLYV